MQSSLEDNNPSSFLITFIQDFFKILKNSTIEYAVLHHGDDLEKAVSSDVDIVLNEDPRLRFIPQLVKFAKESNFTVCQQLYYEVYRGYYLILSPDEHPGEFLHIDCIFDPYGISRYYVPTTFFMKNLDNACGIYQVSKINQTLYLLIKRIIKRSVSTENLNELKMLSDHEAKMLLKNWENTFGPDYLTDVNHLLRTDSAEEANMIAQSIHEPVIRQYNRRHPFRLAFHLCFDLYRKFIRFVRPTGFFIVVLGPDGSGKSTITSELRRQLDRGFRATQQFHWRPGLLPKLSRSNNSDNAETIDNTPAEKSKYGFTISLVRFAYYWLDFVLGYWLKLYPEKAQTTLIIGERYFPDVLVHPSRYGFSLPQWLMRLASKLVPKPDLVILLQDDPETIYKRKAELPVEVISRQISEYELEASHWGESVIIRTDKPAESVACAISDIIIDKCSQRTYKRSGWSRN